MVSTALKILAGLVAFFCDVAGCIKLVPEFSAQATNGTSSSCFGARSFMSDTGAASSDQTEVPIAKVVHVTYKSIKELPQCVVDNFQKLNPDFKIQKWGDAEIVPFLKEHFSQNHAQFFSSIPSGPIKADFFRLAVLYALGGWYIDVDVGLKQSLQSFADPGADVICTASSNSENMNPSIFAARPKNRVILHTLKRMLSFQGEPFNYWRWSIAANLWNSFNDEFDGDFAPSNVATTKVSPKGLKVQLLKEIGCTSQSGTTGSEGDGGKLIATNNFNCLPFRAIDKFN